jgi:P27 family predicted phage terminase small subunit
MRGRKPVPTALRIIRGNPGKRRLNTNEPKPRACVPECPDHLDDEAKREWKRITPELLAAGLLTAVDRAALAAYCQSWSRWVKLERKVRGNGEVLWDPQGEKFYPNPHLGALNKALRQMHEFLSEFGMTPASRVRLGSPTAVPAADPFEEFLRGGQSA